MSVQDLGPVQISDGLLCFEDVKSILNPDRHFAHDGFVIECLGASHGGVGILIASL